VRRLNIHGASPGRRANSHVRIRGSGATKTAPLPTRHHGDMRWLKQHTAFSCHNISNQICISGARTLMHVNECAARLPIHTYIICSECGVISRARLSTRARIKFWHRAHKRTLRLFAVCVMRAVPLVFWVLLRGLRTRIAPRCHQSHQFRRTSARKASLACNSVFAACVNNVSPRA
jgi:hypothetical protein